MDFFGIHIGGISAYTASLAHEAAEHMREREREEARIDRAEKVMVNKFQGRGGGSPEAIQAALGNYAEIHKHKVDAVEQGTMTESETGARNVKRDYTDGKHPTEDKVPVGDLDNPAQRLVVLEHLTQTGEGKGPTDLAECGPSSLIGGALLAGGTKGLGMIMDATLAQCSPEHREDLAKQMEDIRTAMKEGTLNFGHLQALQKDLYTVMQRDMEHQDPDVIKQALESNAAAAGGSADEKMDAEAKMDRARATGGIDRDTIRDFLAASGSSELRESFARNGLSVSHINNDPTKEENGGDTAEHFVLSMKNKQGKLAGVYDPWEREHGQVVTSSVELKGYEQAEHRNITG